MLYKLPNLGEGITEGTVVNVLVKEGDLLDGKRAVIELETNKAVMEIECPYAGKVSQVLVKAGDKLAIGAGIVEVEAAAGAAPAPAKAAAPPPTTAPAAPAAKAPAPSAPAAAPAAGLSQLQLVVIGAGPGGYAAAFYAADLGFKVTLVSDEAKLGGVCLRRGCIPSKALLHAAKVIEESREAEAIGLSFGAPKLDLDKLRSWKDGVLDQLSSGISGLAKSRKVTVVQAEASFKDAHSLLLKKPDGSSEGLAFDRLVIATGTVPAMPKAWQVGDPRVMDSTGALELKDIPGRLLVIGGGIIGLELGSFYASLGSAVTVIEGTPNLVPPADRDLVRPLQARLAKRFAAIHTDTKVESLTPQPDGIHVKASGPGGALDLAFDRVLVAVGRRPATDRLNLAAAGVALTERGFIAHDSALRTNVENVFVIGDIAGEPGLAHKASAEARVAVDVAAGRKNAWDKACIPSVVYTDPEIAWAGLTEAEAKQQGLKVEVARFPWAALGRALSINRTEGLTKLIVDPASDRVLGMGLVGPGAGDLISEGVLAIEMAALSEELAASIHPHPTLSESVMEAAEMIHGTSTHVYRPKRG
jgi:dihydrolipoamide dehydrogenase